MNHTAFVLRVTFHHKPGCEDEFLAFIHRTNDAMRHEPTFVNTVVHRSADDPGFFMLYETWLDQEDFFNVQMKRPYRAEYEARLPDLLTQPREMKIFQPLSSDFGFRSFPSQPQIP